MTAATRNQSTLDTLARNTELIEFIHQHGDKLGELAVISTSNLLGTKVQIQGHKRDSRLTAGSLITWFYLLDDVRFEKPSTLGEEKRDAHVSVDGRLLGHEISVYCRLRDSAAAYVLSLPEVSVHALRRIQVGDVPEVVAA